MPGPCTHFGTQVQHRVTPAAADPGAAMTTTYSRVAAGYDDDHEQALVKAILEAIVATSKFSDCNAVVLQTGELASALLTALAATLARSPATTRSPTAIRRTIDELGKRLRRRMAGAGADPAMQDFLRRVFYGSHVEGSA